MPTLRECINPVGMMLECSTVEILVVRFCMHHDDVRTHYATHKGLAKGVYVTGLWMVITGRVRGVGEGGRVMCVRHE